MTAISVKKYPTRRDLEGKTFDNLTVITRAGRDKHRSALWVCQCVCGKLVQRNTPYLKSPGFKSCGCHQARRGPENLTGRKFGTLTCVVHVDYTDAGSAIWLCKCDCGGEVEVPAPYLKRGQKTRCGLPRHTEWEKGERESAAQG